MKSGLKPSMVVMIVVLLVGVMFAITFDWGSIARQRERDRQAQATAVAKQQVSPEDAERTQKMMTIGPDNSIRGGGEVPSRSTIMYPKAGQMAPPKPSSGDIGSGWFNEESNAYQKTQENLQRAQPD